MKYLGHIMRTLFFDYQKKYNKDWDLLLNEILDEGEQESVTVNIVSYKYNGQTFIIWIGNRWYSYGYLYALQGNAVTPSLLFRPSFKVMVKLYKATHARQSEIIESCNGFFRRHLKR